MNVENYTFGCSDTHDVIIRLMRIRLGDESGAAWAELYLLDGDGREVPFVTGKVNVSAVTWVNDQQLAFLARREGDQRRAAYQISTRGGEARKIFEHATDIVSFDLSADGRWLAYLVRDEKGEAGRRQRARGSTRRSMRKLLVTRLAIADLSSATGLAFAMSGNWTSRFAAVVTILS